MATPGVKGNVSTGFKLKLIGNPDVGGASFDFSSVEQNSFSQGTGVGLADVLFADVRTVAASSNETLDLTSGLTTPLGASAVFAKVKVIDILASSANTNDVVVGAAASNAFALGALGGTTPTVTLPPGGRLRLIHPGAGWTVDSTHKNLKVANGGGTTGVDYTIVLVGTSA